MGRWHVRGVHGANRLASNSLLECLVYGARAGRNAATFARTQPAHPPNLPIPDNVGASTILSTDTAAGMDIEEIKGAIRETLWENVSIERTGEDLQSTLTVLQDITESLGDVVTCADTKDVSTIETVNMLNVALMITQSALARTESRGAHYRSDFPTQEDATWQRRILITRDTPPEIVPLQVGTDN